MSTPPEQTRGPDEAKTEEEPVADETVELTDDELDSVAGGTTAWEEPPE